MLTDCGQSKGNANHIKCVNKFPLAPMGALAPGSAHARPSAQAPIDTKGNFSAQVFGGGWGGGKKSICTPNLIFFVT